MNVKKLKELINELPDDMEVIMSKDGEGNSFSPLSDHGISVYVPETTWSGEVYHLDDLKENGLENEKKSLILWPTN